MTMSIEHQDDQDTCPCVLCVQTRIVELARAEAKRCLSLIEGSGPKISEKEMTLSLLVATAGHMTGMTRADPDQVIASIMVSAEQAAEMKAHMEKERVN